MKGKPAIASLKHLVNDFLWVIELFCVWTRIIFDWCNIITTDCLSNVFEFDSTACLNFFVKEKNQKLPSNSYGQQLSKPEVIMLPEKLRQFW